MRALFCNFVNCKAQSEENRMEIVTQEMRSAEFLIASKRFTFDKHRQ